MKTSLLFNFIFVALFISTTAFGQDSKALEGRWNLTITEGEKEVPSWLEVIHSGHSTLVGKFCYKFGSARPVAEIKLDEGTFSFSIPKQWEPAGVDMQFEGELVGETLKGTMVYTDGLVYNWTAKKAPVLSYTENAVWAPKQVLFNGKNLEGWKPLGENSQWVVENGSLKSPKPGVNLATIEKFTDFKLHAEFRYPEESNSGLYLRGRYEIQIADNIGLEPSNIYFGGVYGHLTPNENVAKAANEWQTYDITLIGRRVTIVANGKTIINDQIIPGMTGGALDNNEDQAGPILIQGDHGPVEFRSLVIQPIVK